MKYEHSPFEVQSRRQRKVPSNDTSCQQLPTAEASQLASATAKSSSYWRVNFMPVAMTEIDSVGETNCPIRRRWIHEIRKSYFNLIRRVTGNRGKRRREWLRAIECGMHQPDAAQSIDYQSPTSNCDPCLRSDRQKGKHASSLDSLINAWPELKPHVREAIITLVDAAQLVESGLTSDEAVRCSVHDCLGRKYE